MRNQLPTSTQSIFQSTFYSIPDQLNNNRFNNQIVTTRTIVQSDIVYRITFQLKSNLCISRRLRPFYISLKFILGNFLCSTFSMFISSHYGTGHIQWHIIFLHWTFCYFLHLFYYNPMYLSSLSKFSFCLSATLWLFNFYVAGSFSEGGECDAV